MGLQSHQNDKVSIILYDAPHPPKYFSFSKVFYKNIFFIIPLILTLTIVLTAGIVYLPKWIKQKTQVELKSPEELSKEIILLNEKILNLENSNNLFQEKLAQAPLNTADGVSELNFWGLIQKPFGFQDIRMQNLVSANQVSISSSEDNKIYFELVNNESEIKLAGFAFVIVYSENSIRVFPRVQRDKLHMPLKFTQGESFAMSRLRPFEFKLDSPFSASSYYQLIVFSREGDLYLAEELKFNQEQK